jgi:membrane associated rhomboid family serine protease
MFKKLISNTERNKIYSTNSNKKKLQDFEYNLKEEYNNENFKIETDISLFLRLIFKLIKYLIFIPVNLILGILSLSSKKKETEKNKNNYFSKIFFEPFLIFKEIQLWLFQAKYTTFLLGLIWFFFIVQIIFLNQNQNLLNSLISHPTHIFSIQIYTLITSLFFHGSLFHIISNSIVLLFFGRIVEKYLKGKVLFVFLIGGFVANLISNLISYFSNDLFYSLGASSGIASLIIFSIFLNPFFLILGIPVFIIGWILIGLDLIGLTNPSQTNNLAHISGYFSLFFLIIFLDKDHKSKIKFGILINVILLSLFFVLNYLFDLKQYFNFNIF